MRRRDDAPAFSHTMRQTGTPRERWRQVDAFEGGRPLTAEEVLQVLSAVPDGWERRSVLRRLVDGARLSDIGTASDVVLRFARRSDRFAAAALLLRAGLADVDTLVASVDPRDTDRLLRRVRR